MRATHRAEAGDGKLAEEDGITESAGDAPPAGGSRPRRRRPRARTVLLGALALLVGAVLLTAGAGYWAYQHYTGRVQRIPQTFPTDAPVPAASKGGRNFLLVGLDSRSEVPTTGSDAKGRLWTYGDQRSDAMMLVHIPDDHSAAYVVSLPRDSWVDVPGRGKAKLNAAFSWGGPPLLIDTVQRLTDVRVDHFAVIDWNGFRKLTDAVGGVDVIMSDGERRHLNGEQALDYVGERKNLPNGDFDRTHRQQNYLRTVLEKVMGSASLTDPAGLKRTLDIFTETVSVDERFGDGEMRELVWNMRSVRAGDMTFMNAPVKGTGTERGQSVVHLDRARCAALWKAFKDDTVEDYVNTHPIDRLRPATN
ncbi:LCP family protein [Streptomyces roseicoloratus]|uniref:LCP family protein n=1 Tax=Streptomyces roseicoloratus TaxID=2508722 RepID=A0ABY9RNM8_9ACTN|nr:LCP family protein [Streptomyces roseicoloratus]WMX43792.1 LCP family protein [Streptomyces roseicoloratus]